MVLSGHARFTILTPQLVRMEWAEDGVFEDRATLGVVNRRLPVPPFRVSREDGVLTIRTDSLTLRKGKAVRDENGLVSLLNHGW